VGKKRSRKAALSRVNDGGQEAQLGPINSGTTETKDPKTIQGASRGAPVFDGILVEA